MGVVASGVEGGIVKSKSTPLLWWMLAQMGDAMFGQWVVVEAKKGLSGRPYI